MNTFGYSLRVTTWGESHGRAVGCVIDGFPAGIEVDIEYINKEMRRRRPGGKFASKRKEEDKVEILSGIFEGKTIGTPVSMLIWNTDVDSRPYEELKTVFRPGHADYTYWAKFGIRDWRGGGRASARETAARVAAGAMAKLLLEKFEVRILGYSKEIAGVECRIDDVEKAFERAEKSPLRMPDIKAEKEAERRLKEAMSEGDSVGGIVEVVAKNVPAGLGEPVFGKLDAYLAYAVMGIPAVKGVEIGAGFDAARKRGSENNDPIVIRGGKIVFESNNAGGILGGISNGEDIIVRAAIKPTASISKRQRTVDYERMEEVEISVKGRHDPCIVPRAVPVVEAMVALTIADCMMLQGMIPRSFR
ncbi:MULTISPECIES: chorismate synthase [unclassified Archaeoglobus]|jgi:chorismate synthase|uniref:chorismate synthase n=1 Tax=unclassified Archaeoglobus TaxID=2643606 RepID=UPI0025C27E82|nr:MULTISPECIES: chorismate synthase [unclassified Archaeoglobus]